MSTTLGRLRTRAKGTRERLHARAAGSTGAETGYRPFMTSHDDDPLEIEDLPAEEGVSGEDAAAQLAESPEDKRNFTETHPEQARRERERHGEDSPDN